MDKNAMPETLMLLNAYYPDDIRVRKEALSLVNAGFRVTLLCRRRNKEASTETINGIEIIRIDAGTSNPQIALRDILISITGKHPEFFKAANKYLSENEVSIIHVHDLPLVGTAVALKKQFGRIAVIADLHENYPEGLKVWHKWKKNPIARLKNSLFMSFNHWKKIENQFVSGADHIIAVVEEMKHRLIIDHDTPESKITVVTNTEDSSFLSQPDNPDIYSGNSSFVISYCGGIGPHRGVDTLIRAMTQLQPFKDISLVISGYGSSSVMKYLEDLRDSLGLQDSVIFKGRVPFEVFYSSMKYAAVNVIPHSKNGHTDHTIPHKLFQAMMAEGTLVVSDVSPLKRVVEETSSGLVFQAGNEEDLAEKILKLYRDKELRLSLASNGKKASENSYNWETTSKSLVQLYNSITKDDKS